MFHLKWFTLNQRADTLTPDDIIKEIETWLNEEASQNYILRQLFETQLPQGEGQVNQVRWLMITTKVQQVATPVMVGGPGGSPLHIRRGR